MSNVRRLCNAPIRALSSLEPLKPLNACVGFPLASIGRALRPSAKTEVPESEIVIESSRHKSTAFCRQDDHPSRFLPFDRGQRSAFVAAGQSARNRLEGSATCLALNCARVVGRTSVPTFAKTAACLLLNRVRSPKTRMKTERQAYARRGHRKQAALSNGKVGSNFRVVRVVRAFNGTIRLFASLPPNRKTHTNAL